VTAKVCVSFTVFQNNLMIYKEATPVFKMSNCPDLTHTVCRLVAYLVSNTVKDETEYTEWGLPFIAMSVEAQFGKEYGEVIVDQITSKFCPLIGHGLSLILEDVESDDYTVVHSAEILLSDILKETESTNVNFDDTLKEYMDNFFHFILSKCSDDVYDARVRVIARRMCDALNITAAEFGELESLHWQATETAADTNIVPVDIVDESLSDSKSILRRKFHEKFNADSQSVPRSSILASFRIWRVAFIATGGGALMALCGRVAAPAIMNTVLPLICASNTVGQVAMGFSTVLSCFGVTSLELIPGIMSSYAAAIAGTKMINRTAPLKDFSLKPLHLCVSERKVIQSSADRSKETSEETEPSPETTVPLANNTSSENVGKKTNNNQTHAPVFILVNGHLERGIDARQLWGADGFLQSVEHRAGGILGQVAKLLPIGAPTLSIASPTLSTREAVKSSVMDADSVDGAPGSPALATEPSACGVILPSTESTDATTNPIYDVTTKETVNNTAVVLSAAALESVGSDSANVTVTTATAAADGSAAADAVQKGSLVERISDWEELDSQVQGWWKDAVPHGEEYVLHWEPTVLESLNESLHKILINKMVGKLRGMVKGEILKFTPIPAIRAAATLPLMLMDKINELDDPWVIAMDRADQAGKLLARVLLAEHRRNRANERAAGITAGCKKGEVQEIENGSKVNNSPGTGSGAGAVGVRRLTGRPVTLVGYGMGARLIFHCLETLAAEGGPEARGIVENAVLIGAPVGTSLAKWEAVRKVVAGRLVNCYAWNDWILALLYRSKSYEIGVAGLYPIFLNSSSNNNNNSANMTATGNSASVSRKDVEQAVITDTGALALAHEIVADPKAVVTAEEKFTALLTGHNTCTVTDYTADSPSTQSATLMAATAPGTGREFGLKPRSSVFEVENCDVSHMISSHTDYPMVLPSIVTMLKL